MTTHTSDIDRYPYFIAPLLEALQTAAPEERTALRTRIACNLGDPDALREILGLDSEPLAGFYPDPRNADHSTKDTIDTFLDKFGKGPLDPDAPLIPTPPAIDYAATYLSDADTPLPPRHPLNTPAQPEAEATPAASPNPTPGPTLSEGLARMMIKNGNYAKALEIITELNLKNPEKSIYFADQIRFLRKLIINQAKKS